MKKYNIFPSVLVGELANESLEKGIKESPGSEYAYAFGRFSAQLSSLVEELDLSPKQKKIMQARMDAINSQRTKKVKNLMTGKDVEIPYNTPLSCDPSSELYWSMQLTFVLDQVN